MYITVMDFSTSTISKLVWDVESATTEQVEITLERMGFHLSQIAYMTTDDEPDFGGIIEVTDVLPNPRPVAAILNRFVKENPPAFDD